MVPSVATSDPSPAPNETPASSDASGNQASSAGARTPDAAGQDASQLPKIGDDDQPIRALSFAGGGFDTAMQLGVTHALLVARAKPPEIVIGASAGAINAVALAEVLQAGDPPSSSMPREQFLTFRTQQRVRRFRELYDAYRRAPGLIHNAYRPDTFQVDTQRPLEPLKLPIHHKLERDLRHDAVSSRSGLINFFNTLLRVNLKFGTVTRAIRRWLGLKAAKEAPTRIRRIAAIITELFRSWALLGQNLHRCVPLVRPILKAALHRRLRDDPGSTAGEMIFRSALWRVLRSGAGFVASIALLLAVWMTGTTATALILWLVGAICLVVANGATVLTFRVSWLTQGALAWIAIPLGAVVTALLAVVLARTDRTRRLLATLWSFVLFALLSGVLIAVEGTVVWLIYKAGDLLGWKVATLSGSTWVIGTAVITIVVGLAAIALLLLRSDQFGRWLLGQFDLGESILDRYPLNQLLVTLFDPDYFGIVDMREVIESALRHNDEGQGGERSTKKLEGYAQKKSHGKPIHVLVTVADIATGDFKVLPGSWRVVDALGAALAAVPVFPPVASDRPWGPDKDDDAARTCTSSGSISLLVDSMNVANEPTRPLFSFLRHHRKLVNEKASALHLYSVNPLPVGRSERDGDSAIPASREYGNLVDVALRAWELRRLRDATLERRMIELHTRAMPADDARVFYDVMNPDGKPRGLVRSWIYPIEPEAPIRASERISQAGSSEAAGRIIAETVADGCRAALQAMMQPSIELASKARADASNKSASDAERQFVRCFEAVKEHLNGANPALDGSASVDAHIDNSGPGLVEVCEHCAIHRHLTRQEDGKPEYPRMLWSHTGSAAATDAGQAAASDTCKASVSRVPTWPTVPPWPLEDGPRDGPVSNLDVDRGTTSQPIHPQHRRSVATDAPDIRKRWDGKWPRARGKRTGCQRPTVSLLFSGGVFRGVFQLGALNALSDVSLVPDVVAGASVGSITAAMAARAFVTPPDLDAEKRRQIRAQRVLRLASVYLAIDRLILTDRFADFIRGFTIRAAEARFSLRDADRTFRRFDVAASGTFSRELRRVAAGIERLTYVSPFELRDLLKALRLQQFGRAMHLLRRYIQEWFDRVGVGNEILGAEPLARLIRDYVLEGLCEAEVSNVDATLDRSALDTIPVSAFSEHGMFFLATSTNLTKGALEIVGEDQLNPCGETTLLGTLLASSAFPGVFRPRAHWEFRPTAADHDQYIDGGVIDNLPLDAVAQFLFRAAGAGLVPARPGEAEGLPRPVPHLLFAASLEPETRPLDGQQFDRLRNYWPGLMRYARQLGYNQKIGIFSRAQENLRKIANTRWSSQKPDDGDDWIPLDLEVAAVFPRWLCGTFAFHPMLGFQRARQAASIAHGCAATLLRLGALRAGSDGELWTSVWGMDARRLPSLKQSTAPDPFDRLPTSGKTGTCWYRPACLCPFSEEGQTEVNSPALGRTRQELIKIYQVCRDPKTHQSQ